MNDDPEMLPAVDYQFWSDAAGAPWSVRELDLREELSGEFAARVELESDDPLADPGLLLGADAVVTLMRPTPVPLVRRFCGVVRAVEEAWGTDLAGRRRCVAVVEPALACLKEERLTRKFQGLTVPDVLRAVLRRWADGFGRKFELRLAREAESPASGRGFASRDLCVQYDETTFDFLRRILAEEGLTYFFDHGGERDSEGEPEADAQAGAPRGAEARERLVITDDNSGFDRALDTYPLRPSHGGATSSEAVQGLAMSRGRSAGRAEARAFNLTQHRPIIEARVRGDGDGDRHSAETTAGGRLGDGELDLGGRGVTLYGYQGDAYLRDDAGVQARLALERSAAAALVGRGSGDVLAFRPGLVFELEPQDAAAAPEAAAGGLLLTGVRHRGGSPERLAGSGARGQARPYANQFTFVPAAVPFRPPLLPKPVAVEDWAEVVSPSDGDPIHTDVHGCVRVRFGYDRTPGATADQCSPWLPVTQAWAGQGYGVQIIPRAGMLVRLHYLHGDPDHPIVTGCLPTSHNALPSPPPDEKTRLTIRTRSLRPPSSRPRDAEHWNEISLDDAPEHEQVFIRAGLDYRQKVLHDESVEIDHDDERAVGHDQKLHVQGRRDKTVQQDESVFVVKNRTVAIAGNDERHVHGNDRVTVEKDQAIGVIGARSTTVHGLETAAYLAGRQESITGDDQLHVSETLTTIADRRWHARQGPTDLVLENGDVTLKAGGNITLEVEGARLRMEPGGKAVLEVNQKLSLLCGEASIVLSPDKVEIAAPEVQLTGASGAVKLDRTGATTTGLVVSSSAMATNELTGAFVKAN